MTSIIRTAVTTLILAAAVLFGFWKVLLDQDRQAVQELTQLKAQMEERLAAREAMINRLSRVRRIAHIRIGAQTHDAAGGIIDTDIDLIELDDNGSELASQSFRIPGDVLFVDAWTVKFGYDDVASGHPFFGHTLVLLRRIYSDRIAPIDGLPIDTPGGVPPGYAVGDLGLYEQRLWEQFWQLATDPEAAAVFGVRVAQGEAVYKPVRTGQVFELTAGAVEGLSLTPLPLTLSLADE